VKGRIGPPQAARIKIAPTVTSTREIFKTNFNSFYTISKWNILQCLST